MEPPERTLYPSRKKWISLLVLSLLVVCIGVLMLKDSTVTALFVIGFFGLGVLVSAANLAPGSAYLRLTSEGYESRMLFRTHNQSWNDIERFHAYKNPTSPNRMVGIVYAPGYRSPRGNGLSKVTHRMIGVDGALPDTYGMSAENLAALMNDWRTRHKKS